MINYLPYYMIRSLVLTLILELGVSALLGVRSRKDFANIALSNILTNPVVVATTFIVNFFTFGNYKIIICIVVMEFWALITEALIYRKTLNFKKINPFLFSLLLNLASYLSGLVINKLF